MKNFRRILLIPFAYTWLLAACFQQPAATMEVPTSPVQETALTREVPTPAVTAQPTAAHSSDPDTEEYAVYSAFLNGNYAGQEIEQILIADQTEVNSPELLQQDLETVQENTSLSAGLIFSFLERNNQPQPLRPDLDLDLDYRLVTEQEIEKLCERDEEGNREPFYDLFPNSIGFLYLSRVGFSDEMDQALLYFEWFVYDQPVLGGYYIMDWQDGEWVIGEGGLEWMT